MCIRDSSLLVQSDTADAGKGLLHCGVWMEVYELCGHNGTGGVLGIIEKLIDLAAGRGIGIPQNTGHHISGHILNDIYRVVQKQLVQQMCIRDSIIPTSTAALAIIAKVVTYSCPFVLTNFICIPESCQLTTRVMPQPMAEGALPSGSPG